MRGIDVLMSGYTSEPKVYIRASDLANQDTSKMHEPPYKYTSLCPDPKYRPKYNCCGDGKYKN